MRLVALMPVRNEDWVLGMSLRVALMWCDAVVVGLHACTDGSAAIVQQVEAENIGKVSWLTFPGATWDEMGQRNSLLKVARVIQCATHIAIVDADEILTGNLLPTIRQTIERMPGWRILQPPIYNLRGGLAKYHSNGTWGQRITSLAFPDNPKLGWSGDKFHHRNPEGAPLESLPCCDQGAGGVMHLWGANEYRLRAKHALYKVTERLRWPAKHVDKINQQYDLAIKGSGMAGDWVGAWTYSVVPQEWWEPYAHLDKYLHLDAEPPWQVAEVRRIVEEHGAETFRGLDLLGVA